MTPRISTLLGDAVVERVTVDLLLQPTPSITQRETNAVERISVQQQPTKQKQSVPIADVLNNDTGVGASTSVPPFSGRLSDLLLDPSQQHDSKRRKTDGQPFAKTSNAAELTYMKLPEPTKLPKKHTKRARIPPLLQGIHHPPPILSTAFPPITGDNHGHGKEHKGKVESRISAEKPARNGKASTICCAFGDGEHSGSTNTSSKHDENSKPLKSTRKRKRWSETETKDLLLGVGRFGIGNWKKILQYPEYQFNQRTAVDLKDRFRICCPGEGLKPRKLSNLGSQFENSPNTPQVQQFDGVNDTTAGVDKLPDLQTHLQQGRPSEIMKLGFRMPFARHRRRERREFTEKDDDNLLIGFKKYSSSWHSMRDDIELGFGDRHATDLRDRFRTRYPELFVNSGHKLGAKNGHWSQDERGQVIEGVKQSEGNSKSQHMTAGCSEAGTTSTESHISQIITSDELALGLSTDANITDSIDINSSTTILPQRPSLPCTFPNSWGGVDDITSSGNSPVILSRNILEWADARALALTAPILSDAPSTDVNFGALTETDEMTIDGLTTFHLPSVFLDTNSNLGQLTMPTTVRNLTCTSLRKTTATKPRSSTYSLLRTPNLPTIVHPHVPMSSARNALHNLPPPAELLSTFDIDTRPEALTLEFVLDDTLGSGISSFNGYEKSSTLAPMMTDLLGRGA